MPTPWTNNLLWAQGIECEVCGRVSDRYTPCQNKKPCPIHPSQVGAGDDHPSVSSAPRFFDPWEAK